MTAVAIPGQGGLVHPFFPDRLVVTPSMATAATIDATGELAAVVGRVYWADRGTHDLRTVGWRTGAITSAGGSGITLSAQDVGATTGIPPRPDGVQDQTKDVLLSALTANAWTETTFTVDRASVAHGAQLAIVWEYDGAGRLGADSLSTSGMLAVNPPYPMAAVQLINTGSWATVNTIIPILLLKGADGAIGTIATSWPVSVLNAHTINNGSVAADEIGNQIKFPGPVTIEGVSIALQFVDAADFSVIFYDGTTATETLTMDEDQTVTGSSAQGWKYFHFATPRALLANTVYRVAIRPDTANNVSVYSYDVSAASYLDLFAGQDFHYWDRVNGGAWANETLTRWVIMRAHLSKIDDGVQVGGGSGRKVIRRPLSLRNLA